MPIKTREVTPRMVEANRKNAQKSTGPRTPQGKQQVAYNALQHGFYAKPSLPFMLATGEDPKELQQILTGLVESFHPFTPAQQTLVEDLAMLRWEKRRNQRAQAAAISGELNTLEIDTEEEERQRDRADSGMSFDRAEVEEKGLIQMPDCPGKFRQILETLQLLLDRVNRKEFYVDSSSALLLLYGHQPSLRGNFLCTRFAEARKQEPEEVGYLKLRMTVTDELIEWNHKYQTYMRRYMEVTPARRDLCFAPTQDVWKLMLRQEESIDRQIERKTRLLWAMQEEDRQRREDPQWQEIVAQAAETRKVQARDQDAELAKKVDDAVVKIVEEFNRIREQSRQAAEKKGRLRRNRVQGQKGRGERHGRGTPRGCPSEAQQETSEPVAGADQPAEAPEKA